MGVTAVFMVRLGVDSHYALLGVAPGATPAEIRAARDRVVREFRERQRREPDRRAELEERQKEVNNAGEELVRPARREQYDRANAHLRFFTVRDAAVPLFRSSADSVDVVHRAICAHLAAAGVAVTPLSDLDRTDFSADHEFDPLLDRG